MIDKTAYMREYMKRPEAKEAQRHRKRKQLYGLSPEQFEALVALQQGACGICLQEMETPFVDHDHVSGRVRGLLCAQCNTGLGMFQDDPAIILRASLYLTAHRG